MLRAIASRLHLDLEQEAALLEKREIVDHRALHVPGRRISASALSHQLRSSCILASGITHEE
jgi:hypothetical protein